MRQVRPVSNLQCSNPNMSEQRSGRDRRRRATHGRRTDPSSNRRESARAEGVPAIEVALTIAQRDIAIQFRRMNAMQGDIDRLKAVIQKLANTLQAIVGTRRRLVRPRPQRCPRSPQRLQPRLPGR